MVKPKDLPFYEEKKNDEYTLVPEEAGMIESNIKIAREGINFAKSQLSEVGDQILNIYETGKAHSQGAYSQLLEEENLAARVGVIAGAGTLGLVVGSLRGRILKRLVYTGFGLGAGAAVCYPIEANQAADEAYEAATKNALAAYNFVAGVPEAGTVNSPLVTDLIASSIKRMSYFLVRKAKEVYLALGSKPVSTPTAVSLTSHHGNDNVQHLHNGIDTNLQKVDPAPTPNICEVSENPPKINRTSELVFVEKFEASDEPVEGDEGQSNAEDSDMYSSRR